MFLFIYLPNTFLSFAHPRASRLSTGRSRDLVPLDGRGREFKDQLTDQRDPKSMKKDSSDQPFVSTPRLPLSHALYPRSGQAARHSATVRAGGGGGGGAPSSASPMSALPPNHSTSGSAAPEAYALAPPSSAEIAEEFSFHNVPPEFKREGSDWFAAFNPKVKRQLDISLVHSFAHTSVVCCVQLSQDGRYLATGCNRTAQIFDTITGQRICELVHDSNAHTGDMYVRSVRFSPDGKLLATGAEDRKIRIWDIANRGIRNTYDGHQQEIYSLDFSLDGRLIVSGSGDRTTRIWDMQDNTCKVFTIVDVVDPSTDAGVTSVAISPRADLVAAGSLANVIRIWDVASGHLVEMLRGHGNSVYSVAFTPDGKGLVTGSLDKTLKLWDVTHLGGRGGRPGGDRDRGGPPSRGGKVDLDRKVGGTIGGSPCIMDFIGHKDYVLSVSMSSDSRWVVSGSKDRCVHVWDSQTAVLQLMLQGHKNSVISLDLNSANDLLATGSGDSYARIWSLTKVA